MNDLPKYLTPHDTQNHIRPVYLQEMVERYMPKRTLRSSDALLLKVPRFKIKTLSARTFAYAAASLWNSLPLETGVVDNIDSFKLSLKTHLFRLAYDIMYMIQ